MRQCSVSGCERPKGKSLHLMPKDPQIRGKWVTFIYKNRPEPVGVSDTKRVCSAHFEDSCFKNRSAELGFATKYILKADAVPTVYPEDTPSTGRRLDPPVDPPVDPPLDPPLSEVGRRLVRDGLTDGQDIVCKPELKLETTDRPQQHVCKEEELPADQRLCIQEMDSSVDPVDPEPLQLKEEQEEVYIGRDGGRLILKQEADSYRPQQHVCKEEELPADQRLCIQEMDSSVDPVDPEPLQLKEEQEEVYIGRDGGRLILKQEADSSGIVMKRNAVHEENISSGVEVVVEDHVEQSASSYSGGAIDVSIAPASTERRKVVRKYDSSYLKLGFSLGGTEEEPRPQCVVCGQFLSNASMKPAHLRRHLLTKHAALKDKPLDYFLRKRDELKTSKPTIQSCVTPAAKALEASYRASLRIARAAQPHTIGEQLCLPLAKEMTNIMCGEKAAQQLNLVRLSNDTVSRRIRAMAENVKKTLTERLQRSRCYSLQLDETADAAASATLLAYVRYECDGAAREDFLFCQPLEGRTTAEHIFQLLDTFIQENGLRWEKCVGVCTDGAGATAGRHGGVAARIQRVAPGARWTHCSIRREALAVRKMPDELKAVLDSAVRTVNFIKARPTHSRLFHVLCDEMGGEHVQLLLHTDVGWLSRGKVLSRLLDLHREVQVFLQDKNLPLSRVFEDTVWLSRLAYLSDIFSRLNELTSGLQGLSVNVFDVQDRVGATLKKMELFEAKVKAGDVSAFPALEAVLSDSGVRLDAGVRDDVAAHLASLRQQLREYFPKTPETNKWMRNPFSVETSAMPRDLSVSEQRSLTELSCDEALKSAFRRRSLLDFWIQRRGEYPALSDKAVRFLLPFATTYLCERGFSSLAVRKRKQRMDAEADVRLKLTAIDPDIAELCVQRQAGPSHQNRPV